MRSILVLFLLLFNGVMLAQVPAHGVISDDFSGSTLNSSLWTFVNPRGDVTLAMVGAGTANARVSLTVPAGVIHDAWTGGITAPRVMQTITNTDFEVDARFDSPVTAQYQIQGILIQQDATNFIRFDFVRDASATRFFAANFVNDVPTVRVNQALTVTAPFFIRVKRQGNQWTGSYSADGTTWTQVTTFAQALTVSSIGPWAGNAGSPSPAFTALIDYFFSTASPIVPEDPTGSATAPSFTSQPLGQVVTVGQTATFAVTATGTAPLSYQWQKNAVNIGSATASSYTTPVTVIGDNGAAFRCVVTNSISSATSNAATLTVSAIATPGGSNIITNGSFESGATGWTFYTNGSGSFAVSSGGTDGTQAGKVAITTEGSNVQLYHAQVPLQPNTAYQLSFDAFSSTGHDANIMLGQHGTPFTNYGLSTIVDLGTGWQHYTLNFTSANFSTPVTDGRLTFLLSQYDANGDQYSFDNVTLMTAGVVAPGAAPSITSQPLSQSVTVGQTATFSVTATGTAPLSYQWQKNAVNISNATASSYTTPATVIGDNGAAFRCVVTNSINSTTSNAAALTVSTVAVPGGSNIITNGSFESGATGWTFYTNGSASFAVGSGGTDGIQAGKVAITTEGSNVQLYHAQVPLQPNTAYQLGFDAFSSTGHNTDVMLGQHGAPFTNYGLSSTIDLGTGWQHYTLNFTSANFSTPVTDGRLTFLLSQYDANGDQFSFDNVTLVNTAVVAPGTAPSITSQPAARTVTVGQTATFAVTATGTAPLSYQWQKNAANIGSATTSSYTTPVTVIGDNGATFRCVVTNSVNSATSTAAILTVGSVIAGGTDIPFQHTIIDASGMPSTACKALGDLDGDGFIDIATASSTDPVAGLVWYRYPRWEKFQVAQGIFTTEMKLADIDGDGDLDMVIPRGTYDVATVYWYENPLPARGPATGPWTMHVIGDEPGHDISVADIDKDGRPDVVVRDRFRTVVFFQAAGGVWTRKNISTRPSEGTSLGDLDGDGDLDVVINGYWLQNPLPQASPITGTWIERTIDATWPSFARTYTVDLNKDGRLDVIFSVSESPNSRFSWFESTSPVTGPWTEHIIDNTLSYLHCIAVADMDLDGNLDVITAEMHQSSDPDLVCVYRNGGNALSWNRQILATTGSHNMVVGDIGRDGDMDILGSNWESTPTNAAPTEIWENLLHAKATNLDSWSRHVIDANRPWRSMFITSADIDRDSRPDIVAGGWWYKNPGVLSNPWVRTTIGSPLNNMATVYDFDHDGAPDILGTKGVDANSNADFVWARNNGSGGFTIFNNVPSGEGDFLQGVAVGKFRHDTTAVALSWHEPGHGVQMLTPPSDPTAGPWIWQRVSTISQHEQLSAGDIDRDGDADLMMGTQWLRNDPAGWSALTLNSTTGAPDRNRLGDFNNDGRVDVVVGFEATTGPSKLAWYEQPVNASSTWQEHVIATLPAGAMSVDVADMDGDGDLDVVVGEHHNPAQGGERMLVYENLVNLGGSWAEHVVYTGDEHHDGAQLVDIDGDGDLDIISLGWTNTLVVLYENLAIHTSSAIASVGGAVLAKIGDRATSPEPVPTTYSLSQNYPNPFNPTTMIRFGLPERAYVTLTLYNLLGQQVAQLVNGDLGAGYHDVRLTTGERPELSSGVYFYRIQVRPSDSVLGRDSGGGAGSFVETHKLVLLR